jgi:glycosyltransferase involved in cell wall biosynthesis
MQGGQWQVLYLARGLRERGHEVAARAKGELAERLAAEGFPRRLRGKADVIHAHDARAHTEAWLRGWQPLVVSRRVAFPAGSGWLSRRKYGAAQRYIAVSEYVRRVLGREARVVYDGVPELTRRAEDTGVVIYDKRRGGRLDVERLGGARIFVYLTAMEGLGSAALLAMSAGIPVVASRVGGLPEAVVDGETGLLVDDDGEAAITRLLGDEQLAARLGRAGRERYRAMFTVDRMVEATLAVYREVVG